MRDTQERAAMVPLMLCHTLKTAPGMVAMR